MVYRQASNFELTAYDLLQSFVFSAYKLKIGWLFYLFKPTNIGWKFSLYPAISFLFHPQTLFEFLFVEALPNLRDVYMHVLIFEYLWIFDTLAILIINFWTWLQSIYIPWVKSGFFLRLLFKFTIYLGEY